MSSPIPEQVSTSKTDEEIVAGLIGLVADKMPSSYIERLEMRTEPAITAMDVVDAVLTEEEQTAIRAQSKDYIYFLRHDFDSGSMKELAALEGAAHERVQRLFESLGQTAASDEGPTTLEVVSTAEEHQRRAALLGTGSNILSLIVSKLSGYRITDSNPIDTGSVNISTREIMRASGVYNVRGAQSKVSHAREAVRESQSLELEKAQALLDAE